MPLARFIAFALVGLLVPAPETVAAQLSIIPVETLDGSATYILLENEVEVGDWSAFFRLVRRTPTITGVALTSIGGSADDGLAIAKYIFEQKLDTLVTDACHSICAIMFLAGDQRFLAADAALTVHGAYKRIGDWVVTDHLANGTIAWFIGHMGYPLPVARLWTSTPSDGAAPITLEMNERLQLGITIIE